MGRTTKCFHCWDEDLSVGIVNMEDSEVVFHCGGCGNSFRFDVDETVKPVVKRKEKIIDRPEKRA